MVVETGLWWVHLLAEKTVQKLVGSLGGNSVELRGAKTALKMVVKKV